MDQEKKEGIQGNNYRSLSTSLKQNEMINPLYSYYYDDFIYNVMEEISI